MYYGDNLAGEGSSVAAYGSDDLRLRLALSVSRLIGAYYEDKDRGPATPKPHIDADEEILDELDPRMSAAHCQR